jgi:hypothetical protein
MSFQDFATHFLDEDVVHIDDLLLLRDTHIALGILTSCVTHKPLYLTWTIPSSSSFLSLLAGFSKRVMQVCGDIMSPG